MDSHIFGTNRRLYQEESKDYSGDEKSDEKKDSEDDVDVKDGDREKVTDDESDDDDDDELYVDSDVERERNWKNVKLKNARPPHPLTVTHVNQSRDLQRVEQSLTVVNADKQNSEEWLQTHSIEFLKLTLQDLIDKGQIGKLTPDKQTGKANHQIQFEAYDVNEFEYKLNVAIEMYTKRIKYLLQGSKRMFGHLKGDRVALCVDVSDANMGFGRQTAFQESLLHLLDEQLSVKSGLYLMEFGTEPEPLWPVTRDVNCRITDEAKEWVMRLQPRGGCNLLKAMKHLMKVKDVDTIVLVLGSAPDQPTDILCDYVHQMGVGKDVPLHAVAYDCSNQLTNVTLRNLSDASTGRYHCYAASCEEQIYTGTDISLLLKEIQKAQDVINKIKEMRRGLMGSAIINIMNEITTEVSKLPQSRFLPRPPGHELPLRIDTPKFQPRSSVDWLCQHGLKAKRLDLYQVLSPNAYSYREEFIPIIKKAVQSQVHEKAMVQFTWHDGSVKNIHVDMTQLFEYQKQLKEVVGLYERRIDWLASGSRRIFGTICEKNIVVLIDTSVSNVNYLVHIQHSLRLLMEQQIANKDYFNLIAFGSIAKSWRPTMVRPTPQNLQDAWKWVLGLQCSGSRNFLSAFRMAVENEEEVKHKIHVQGVYLFTSGVPDQPQDVAISFIEEASSGRPVKLHSILFNVDDYDGDGAIPGRYANITRTSDCLRNMAHSSGGRFHWFRETGIIESDDIQFVNTEVDKALNFSRKVALLIDNVKKKYRNRFQTMFQEEIRSLPSPESSQMKSLPPSSRQATSRQSQRYDDEVDSLTEQLANSRGITWRPSSASRVRDSKLFPKPPNKERPTSAKERPSSSRERKDPMQRVRSIPSKKISCSHFFLDKKQETGSVYTKYQNTKVVRKSIGQPNIPEQEDSITSKEWLRLFGLSKLKLDLTKLVSGPDCKHVGKKVKSLHKNVSAKYCDIFPSINIKGTLKHLQLLPHELEEYENQVERVLRRYLKRLQWLLSGSRRVFGTVIQKNCIFLIDTSGSMDVYMKELKKELAALIWEQLNRMKINFNLIRFSGACENWRSGIQPPTEENCHNAIAWSSKFVASGNTCTLEALQMAFSDPDVDGIYLLTDGKPDTSTSLILREVAKMNIDRTVPVNTISFNCSDNTANNFLHLLAKETGGRYHRCHGDFDAHMFTHKLLSEGFQDAEYPHLPQFDGDDLRGLGAEITQARKYLAQARTFRALYKAKAMNAEKEKICTTEKVPSTPFLVGRAK
ncbi:von Willebrand factor A domain-containing protein 3A-like [Gigantopelta aegis]|uniref:von Willebrand factor A domain-containing protein 3A-like n=1 Tax=Gigantopelta aegis TaxID=1735272 RepID=UPI001B88C8D2|nr:von Willebrand factor A domain-containing protein 3A-like [Gigantopelta aegis]